jgi:hypothetical protein
VNKLKELSLKPENDSRLVNASVATLEERCTRLEGEGRRFESILENFTTLAQQQQERRFDSLLGEVKTIGSEVESVRDFARTTKDCLSRLQSDLASLRQELPVLSEMRRQTDDQGSELRTLSAKIAELAPSPLIRGFHGSDRIKLFVPRVNSLYRGMIGYLTRRYGGHVCDTECVDVFSDSVYNSSGSYLARNVADLFGDSVFVSSNIPNQSIGYDFKENQLITPTHYAIRSQHHPVNCCHPKSWVIEVTNDESGMKAWTEIDRRVNNNELNGKHVVRTFEISPPVN